MPEPTPGIALNRPAGRGQGSLGAQPALRKLENGQRPSIEELRADRGARSGDTWTPSGLRLTNLAMFELELATRLSPGDAQRAKLLERSESLVEGLLQSPCDGYAWLRLAIVQDYRGLPARKVAAPLMASIESRPIFGGVGARELSICSSYSTVLTSEELYEVRHQLRTIWSEDGPPSGSTA